MIRVYLVGISFVDARTGRILNMMVIDPNALNDLHCQRIKWSDVCPPGISNAQVNVFCPAREARDGACTAKGNLHFVE